MYHPWFNRQGLWPSKNGLVPALKTPSGRYRRGLWDGFEVGAEFFGINEKQSNYIFGSGDTQADVVEHIKEVIEECKREQRIIAAEKRRKARNGRTNRSS